MLYAVIDVETTGGRYNEEGITEIAIYKFDGLDISDKMVSLVNPERPIMPFVSKLTGISNKMVQKAPKFYQIAKRVIDITDNCIIVAHNSSFDYRILQMEFSRLGYQYYRETICTVQLSRRLIPNEASYSLGNLTKSLGIITSKSHRADQDAFATLKLFKILLVKDTTKTIIKQHIKAISPNNILKRHLQFIKKMPQETGVFYIYNASKEIIYIDFSFDIRARLNSIFIGKSEIHELIQKQTKDVSFEITGSLLLAKIKFLNELKLNRPVLNKPLLRNEEDSHTFSYPANHIGIIDNGRHIGERSIVYIKDGKLNGIGYFELNLQLKMDILKTLITPISSSDEALYTIERHLKEQDVLDIVEF